MSILAWGKLSLKEMNQLAHGTFPELLLYARLDTGSGSENFYYKVPGSQYFKLCKPYCLCPYYSTLQLCYKSSHRQYIKQ